ncbi:hypothetical protein ACKKBG_A18555 [Auxenochlorella protothecoides x Auxenochlorella symbiontica]
MGAAGEAPKWQGWHRLLDAPPCGAGLGCCDERCASAWILPACGRDHLQKNAIAPKELKQEQPSTTRGSTLGSARHAKHS